MIDQWLLQDLKKIIHRHKAVIVDPAGQCSFLIPLLRSNGYQVLSTDSTRRTRWEQEKDELFLRVSGETERKNENVIFYTTRSMEDLSFLYDYCFTHGCLDLSHPQEWLKKKIFNATTLQVHLENPMLMRAAKLGVGKDLGWWRKIVQHLEELIDLDEELLPFVHDPEAFLNSKDEDIRKLFEEKVHELLGQQYLSKVPRTLADEVVKRMLDGLVYNDIPNPLLQLYYKWSDSTNYRPSLEGYIAAYKLNGVPNPWNAHSDHCFEKLDVLALRQIVQNFRDKKFVMQKLDLLKKRIHSTRCKFFVPLWWQDINLLFNADTTKLSSCKNLNNFIEYYTESFSKVDRAIRNLYATFLHEESIIRPLQEAYEGLNHLVLHTWYSYTNEYRSDQQGFLPTLLTHAKPKIAIIVADGLRYEIADYVARALNKQYAIEKQVMLADMPSETEHNMSALYVGRDEVLPVHGDREIRLHQLSKKPIANLQLEQLHYGIEADYLILTYKDIDSAGEKLQQGAIKLFSEFESILIDKIALLLNMGYREVHLVTDHGFVLTGLLDEADKIETNVKGKKEVHERFIRTVEKQPNNDWIGFEEPYEEYKYVYVAKSQRPFKSRGVYGYSHGGFTPQEIILPKFKFTKAKTVTSKLEVLISNKTDLRDIPGELFTIKVEASNSSVDLFDAQRKVQLKFYAGNQEYQSSTIMNIETGKVEVFECSFNNNTNVTAVLLDAITQEQLDSVKVNKLNIRDLGGLL